VAGSVTLLAGQPDIGKSTTAAASWLMPFCNNLARGFICPVVKIGPSDWVNETASPRVHHQGPTIGNLQFNSDDIVATIDKVLIKLCHR